jgi:glycosyltransferase involved in cell wall biosynthesis
MKMLVIIPAFNEEKVIGSVVGECKSWVKRADILVVDDGSSDKTGEKALKSGAMVVKHVLNRGLGGAIGTGIKFARDNNYELAITIDADGQHDPKEIKSFVEPIKRKKADVVIGTRMKNRFQVPIDRRIIITLSNLLTFVFFGFWTSDSLSGFRGFSKKALSKINIRTQRMEVSNELFSEIGKHNLKYKEIPIRVKYTEYSRSKGQTNLNAINVLFKLLLRLAR